MSLASLRGTVGKDAISALSPERDFPMVDAQPRISDAWLIFVFASRSTGRLLAGVHKA